jgi:glycosyltransferase involved in cell wall biosynthesis
MHVGFDIICLSTDPWGPVARRRRHLMSALVKQGHARQVLFVEPGELLGVVCRSEDIKATLTSAVRRAIHARRVSTRVSSITPLLPLPLTRFTAVRRLNVYSAIPSVRIAIRQLGIRRPVVWISNPVYAPYVGHLGEQCLVFDRTDAWQLMPDTPDSSAIARAEQRLCARADIVFAVSQALLSLSLPHARSVALLPNAADPTHFNGASKAVSHAPGTLPVIGYVGSLWPERLDIELIAAVAKLRPAYRFEFVGPTHPTLDSAQLQALPNVQLRGPVDYDDLPTYLRRYDVAWIPHRVGSLTDAMNPIKLWEYLAMGLPVVSTPIAGLEAVSEFLFAASSADEIAGALDHAIATDTSRARAARLEAISRHTWAARADSVAEHLLPILDRTFLGRRQA